MIRFVDDAHAAPAQSPHNAVGTKLLLGCKFGESVAESAPAFRTSD
ncbi:hypothetical protein Poly41_41940 [Novipirellula artificiosorum]|uniref:Uncharacterized protein n=1 Tax=Novipirellula artificiosorum TaxID=2528016 RepID=A0A5C6DE27_9BACT|nr:hypothetical protein Poly41_41940 [Novipirellula artificiosorum]